ncbi:MAG: carbohydrate kinase family protein [Planctomycetota bacterium]
MERAGIACVGNWIIDHVKTITSWPREETLATILSEELGTGGSAYNVLVDLSRFRVGIPLYGVGLVGDDADGRKILQDGRARGIDMSRVRTVPGVSTSYTDVMAVKDTGRRTFFHHRGANALLGPEHISAGELPCRVLNLGYLLLLDRLDEPDPEHGTRAARVLAAARSAGIWTSIDVVSEHSDRFQRIVRPSLPHADFCIVNEFEAGQTTGREIVRGDSFDWREMEGAARDLLRLGVRKLAVIHTPQASVGVSASGEVRWQPSHDLPPGFIAGTVGAGDAFLAGMLVGIHEGWDLGKTLRFATAAATSCLRHPTTTGGVVSAEEIWRLAGELPYRKI